MIGDELSGLSKSLAKSWSDLLMDQVWFGLR
jgi:hypothetical protein